MIVKKLSVNVNSQVQHDFKEAVKQKHDRIKGFYGSEIENIMKLYLTLNGASDYSDDPDVQELLEAAKKTPCTHTHTHDDEDDDRDLDTNWNDPEYLEAKVDNAINKRFQKFEEFFQRFDENMDKKVEQKVRKELENTYSYSSTPPKKQTPMDMFLESFTKEYGEWTQVSYNELSHLAIQVHGISDKRSIQNRINYLIGKGVIKEFGPNVYNVL